MGKTTFTYGRRRRDLGLLGGLAHRVFHLNGIVSPSN